MKDGNGKSFDMTDAYLKVSQRSALKSGALYDRGYHERNAKAEAAAGSAVKSAAIVGGLILASAIIPFLAPVLIPVAVAVGGWAAFKGGEAATHTIKAKRKKTSFNKELEQEIRNQKYALEFEKATQKPAKRTEQNSGKGQGRDDKRNREVNFSTSQQNVESEPGRNGNQRLLDGLLDINEIGKKGDKNRDKFVDHLIKSSGFDKMNNDGQDKFLNDINEQINEGGLQKKSGINEKEKLEINVIDPAKGRVDDKTMAWTSALGDMATELGINDEAKQALANKKKTLNEITKTIRNANVDFSDEKYSKASGKERYKYREDPHRVLAEKIYNRAGLGGEGVTPEQKSAFTKAFVAGVEKAKELGDAKLDIDNGVPAEPVSVANVKDIAAGAGAELAVMPNYNKKTGKAWRRNDIGMNKSEAELPQEVQDAVYDSIDEEREKRGNKLPQQRLELLPKRTNAQGQDKKEVLMRESTTQEAIQKKQRSIDVDYYAPVRHRAAGSGEVDGLLREGNDKPAKNSALSRAASDVLSKISSSTNYVKPTFQASIDKSSGQERSIS